MKINGKPNKTSPETSLIARAIKAIDTTFEDRFQKVARNPHLLALLARSINVTSNLRIEFVKVQTEISSLKARSKVHFK